MAMKADDIINILYLIYSTIRSLIQSLFSSTIARASPDLAFKFADAMTMLISLTTVWIIFEFTTGLKKIVRTIILLGWVLLMFSMIVGFAQA